MTGFGGGAAGAAARTNAKFCKDYQHDNSLVANASSVSQLGNVPGLIRKLVPEAPKAMRSNLQKFAGEVQTFVSAGGFTSKSEQKSFTTLSNKLLAQEKAACKK